MEMNADMPNLSLQRFSPLALPELMCGGEIMAVPLKEDEKGGDCDRAGNSVSISSRRSCISAESRSAARLAPFMELPMIIPARGIR